MASDGSEPTPKSQTEREQALRNESLRETNGNQESNRENKRIPPEPASTRLSIPAVQALYETHSRELLAFLTGLLKDADAATDVAQSVYKKLLESGHTADQQTIRGWLFKVAYHEAMALKRKSSLTNNLIKGYAEQHSETILARAGSDELVTAEEVTRLKQVLDELPPEQKTVVHKRIYEEKTFATIAAELNVPLGTILTRMRLAMDKLRQRLRR